MSRAGLLGGGIFLWVSSITAGALAQGPPSAGFPPAEEPTTPPPPTRQPAPAPTAPPSTPPPKAQPQRPQPEPPGAAPPAQPAPTTPAQPYPAPAPVQQYPAPASAQQYPAPAPVQQYPAPAPLQQYPAPAPLQQPTAPTYGQPYPAAPPPRPELGPDAPILPPPPPNVCKDHQVSAYESDVDCGGVCGPCAIEKSCREPNDCVSGLCRAGVCHERLYEPGTPVPKGYELQPANGDRASTARIAGIGFFAIGYGAAYVAALSSPTTLSWLYVPLIGPWPVLGDVDEFAPKGYERTTKLLLVADGALQIAGALMWLGGTLGRRQQLRRLPPPNPDEVQTADTLWLLPTVSHDGYALQVGGLF